jgi:hypothetical protein
MMNAIPAFGADAADLEHDNASEDDDPLPGSP